MYAIRTDFKTTYNNYHTYIEIVRFNNYVEIPTKIEQTINNQFTKPIVIDVFGLIQKVLRKCQRNSLYRCRWTIVFRKLYKEHKN